MLGRSAARPTRAPLRRAQLERSRAWPPSCSELIRPVPPTCRDRLGAALADSPSACAWSFAISSATSASRARCSSPSRGALKPTGGFGSNIKSGRRGCRRRSRRRPGRARCVARRTGSGLPLGNTVGAAKVEEVGVNQGDDILGEVGGIERDRCDPPPVPAPTDTTTNSSRHARRRVRGGSAAGSRPSRHCAGAKHRAARPGSARERAA